MVNFNLPSEGKESSAADYQPAPDGMNSAALSHAFHNHHEANLASSYEDDTDYEDAVDERAAKPWDEGGPSDCGYSTTVHDTLMSVGEKVHALVGGPSQKVRKLQESVGSWFQELSYATRDILRGENTEEMHKDAADAVNTLFYGSQDDAEHQLPPPQDDEDADDEKKTNDAVAAVISV
jgi:hypothetical protein